MADAEAGPRPYILAGVMGWPVMHSLSPRLHGHWFARYDVRGAYVPLEIRPERLESALRALPALGFRGCNLTIPHKMMAVDLLDDVDETARRSGSANCVTVGADGRLVGTSTDGFGFLESLRAALPGWSAAAGPAVLLGAGGAARAIAVALLDAGASEIRLSNRTRARAEDLAGSIGGPVRAHDWAARGDLLDGAALVVNATSQGMAGQPPLDVDLGPLPASALVADIVYTPRDTPLLRAAQARGNRVVDGLGMLLHQARPCWQVWIGLDPEVTPELEAELISSP